MNWLAWEEESVLAALLATPHSVSRSCCQRKKEGQRGKKKDRKKRERRYWFPGVSGLPWRADLCRSESGNQLLRTLTGRPRMSHSFLVQEKKVARVRGMPTHPRKPPHPPSSPPPPGTACQLFSAVQSALGAGQTKQCVDKVQGWGKTTKEGLFSCTHTERYKKRVFLISARTRIRFFSFLFLTWIL